MASMLDTIMLDHFAYRETHDTALTRCFVGPPGCGKSTAPAQAAALLDVPMYTLSLLTTDPMEVRGYDTPGSDGELIARVASHWRDREPYSIVVFEELDKAYLQQLHSVIDLMTSRKVGDYELPPLHFLAVANSAEFASPAVLDRLLVTGVPDPRTNYQVFDDIVDRIVEFSGLHPDMRHSTELKNLVRAEVLPPYDVLDGLKGKTRTQAKQGLSERRIIAMINGRAIENSKVRTMLTANNQMAEARDQMEYYNVHGATSAHLASHINWEKMGNRSDLTPKQRQNVAINAHISAYILNQPEKE